MLPHKNFGMPEQEDSAEAGQHPTKIPPCDYPCNLFNSGQLLAQRCLSHHGESTSRQSIRSQCGVSRSPNSLRSQLGSATPIVLEQIGRLLGRFSMSVQRPSYDGYRSRKDVACPR